MNDKLNNKLFKTYNLHAFTIVELLIVIVVIGILAAISIVSYTGITKRAGDASLQADLSNASKKLKLYYALYGVFPTDMQSSDGNKTYCPTGPTADTNYCIKPSNGSVFTYSQSSGGQDFSLIATKTDVSYRITKDIGPTYYYSGTFARTWGGAALDFANSIVQTVDGGYALAGQTANFGAGGYDVILNKYDSSGNLSWSKTWGGTGSDYANSLIQTNDYGYTLTGCTSSYSASDDAFLIKFDVNGNLSWSKTWGGTGSDYAWKVIQSYDNNYVITGQTSSYGAGSVDAFLAKFDNSGNLLWNRTLGGANADVAQSLTQSDSGYVLSGWTNSYGSGSQDVLISKFDFNGTLLWTKTWGGTGDDRSYDITRTNDNGYALAGLSTNKALIVKYDSNGDVAWNNLLGENRGEIAKSIIQTNDGGYSLVGSTASYGAGSTNEFLFKNNVFLAKFGSGGSFSWIKVWGNTADDYGNSMAATIDGGYVIAGYTDGYGQGGFDTLLLKFKSDGAMNNCTSPLCQSPTVTVTTPSASVTTPSSPTSSPSATVTSPTATVTTPSGTVTTVVAP